jgi:hypothetical protein
MKAGPERKSPTSLQSGSPGRGLPPLDALNFVQRFAPPERLRGLLTIPWVEYRNTEASEVLHVASDDRKIMLKGGCGDHAVRNGKRLPGRLPQGVKNAPTLGYGLRNGKNTLPEQKRDFDFDIVLQLHAAGGTLHQKRCAASQFAD